MGECRPAGHRNAGAQTWKPLLELEEGLYHVSRTNLKGCFAVHATRPHGTCAKKIPFPNFAHRSVGKGGLERFTKSAASGLTR